MTLTNSSGEILAAGGCAPVLDTAIIITKVGSPEEAHELPCGSLVGDLQGGLTFSDDVAAELESRSMQGWREVQASGGDIWTVILLNN